MRKLDILEGNNSGFVVAKRFYLNRIRYGLSMFYFAMGLSFASWASRIPSIKSDLKLNAGELGAVLIAMPVGQLLMMFFAAKLVRRFESFRVVPVCTLLYAFVLIIIGLAQNIWQLAMALVCFGILANLANISINTQGVYTEKLFKRAIMASFHGMWSLAGFSGALVGIGTMALKISTFMHFVFVALIVIVLVVFSSKYLIIQKEKVGLVGNSRFSKPDPSLIILGTIGFCCLMSEGLMYDWSGIYFKDVVKATGPFIVIGYSSFMIMMAAGRFLGDKLSNTIGQKKLMQINGIMIAIGLFTAVVFPHFITCTIAFMLVGLGVSTVMPSLFSIAGKHKTIPTAEALITVYSISFIGFFMGPIIGYIARNFGLEYSFAIVGVFGILIFFLVKRVKDSE